VASYVLHGHIAGIHPMKATEILAAVTKPGHRVPEPLRLADSFASSMPTDSPPEIADAEIAPQPAAIDGTPITQEDARMVLISAYKAKMREKLAAAEGPRPAAPAVAPSLPPKPAVAPAAAAVPAVPPAATPAAAPAASVSTPASVPAAAAPAKPAAPPAAAPAAKPAPAAGAPPAAAAVKPAVPPPPKKKEEARIDWDKAIAAATWRPAAKVAAAKREVGPIGRFDADVPLRKGAGTTNAEYLAGSTGQESTEEK